MRSMRSVVVVLSLTGCTGSDSSDADLAALTARVTALETDNEQLRVDLTAATTRITALESGQTVTNGSLTTLQGVVAAGEAAIDNRLDDAEADVADLQTDVGGLQTDVGEVQVSVGAIEAAWVTGETTWDVGPSGDYTTLAAAWAATQDVRLAAGATLTIALGNGSFPVSGALNVDHPDGDRIFITGTGSATTTVSFAAGGFVLDQQHRLGGIEGLTVDTTLEGTEDAGIWVDGGSSTHLTDVVLKDFYYGLRVSRGGLVEATDVAAHANEVGALAETGGVLDAPDLDASDNQIAIAAAYGSVIMADGLDATSSGGLAGFIEYNSVMQASSSDFTGNYIGPQVVGSSTFIGAESDYGQYPSGIAVEALATSYVAVSGSDISNTEYGIIAEANGFADAIAVTTSNLTTPTTESDGGIVRTQY